MSAAISAIIPTADRGALLEQTLLRCRAVQGDVELEYVVVDDGSQDDTPQRLAALAERIPGLRWQSVPKGGPARARNLGASLARNPVLLFLGDDIEPQDGEFFRVHAELHAQHPERDLGVLGKIVWPNRRDWPVSLAMALAQGREGDQFRYADLLPYQFVDWRHFYTANASVKRSLVEDWCRDGFSSAFPLASYEDGEFAYRMSLRREPLRVLYAPLSVGLHHHHFSAGAFLDRQLHAGMMASIFAELHPEESVRVLLGVDDLWASLQSVSTPEDSRGAAECLSVIEGIKSLARLLDERQSAGSQPWHAEMLRAAFLLARRQGFVLGAARSDANVAAAYYVALEEFVRDMKRVIHVELTGRTLSGRGAEALFGIQFGVSPPLGSRLQAWLRRIPGGTRLARAARRLWRDRV